MSTLTGGTKATTTLTALQFPGQFGGLAMSDADVATIANAIKNDLNGALWPGAFSKMGLLYVPNRGVLQMQPGDFVMVGPDGFPYLVPEIAAPMTLTATAASATSGTPGTITFSSSVLTLGWMVGAAISGTNVAAGATITAISANGLVVSCNTSGTPSGVITVGSFTHS